MPDPDIGICDWCGSEDGSRIISWREGVAWWICTRCKIAQQVHGQEQFELGHAAARAEEEEAVDRLYR